MVGLGVAKLHPGGSDVGREQSWAFEPHGLEPVGSLHADDSCASMLSAFWGVHKADTLDPVGKYLTNEDLCEVRFFPSTVALEQRTG